ncbi:hypothetical protein C882_4299 [Caenispirillum salinarum AK4]|uniref:site-specific DNA-methyltransferase (adenine-specific) n=1 Tax=Caenispirillum salinarum AK4 TaxID=1238182 RepID=K9GWF6_9PROT|nr:DNA methyltransferase [Caenispirillum salinarum]EKV30340.1 hypothetical protein C882_4299 [Caenispirillum salinarum AK4]
MPDTTPPADPTSPAAVEDFIDRWSAAEGAERGNYQLFLVELCALLGLDRPDPQGADTALNDYVFERKVTFQDFGETSHGWIDLYKAGHFVLEAKQGVEKQEAGQDPDPAILGPRRKRRKAATGRERGTSGYDRLMARAREQALSYARAIAAERGDWVPFLLVVDVGHSIEVYADFSKTGTHFTQFPDGKSFRIALADLRRPEVRRRLRAVWRDPAALDPSRHSEKVTRAVSRLLAHLGRSLTEKGHDAEAVARFLMRCLFTMFAEDVGLLRPREVFTTLLKRIHAKPSIARDELEDLWKTMNKGGYYARAEAKLLRFNGGLFADPVAFDLTRRQIECLLGAARKDWKDVEPAIFGTLLERALNPRERRKLGAHYTPRSYVERLVLPTVIEPLRAEWDAVKAAAYLHHENGEDPKAVAAVRSFHQRLCETRVLDPACGSGNFLYVTMEHMKRLEGEVLDLLQDLGDAQYTFEMDRHTVDPHQFLGLEKNPWAASAAEMVLWIGYLQWHFRTQGKAMPTQPVLRKFGNIRQADAVLSWRAVEPRRDGRGRPLTRWDGETRRIDPVTGESVPDETARVPLETYREPRGVEWPEADYIVGNPPFLGGKDLRDVLGDGYTEALWSVYSELPRSTDYVMYWWHKAANLVRAGRVRRFGFITTNSLPQTFNRRIVAHHLEAGKPLSLLFAIPDHPWVDAEDGAAVRIAMTVGVAGKTDGRLNRVTHEDGDDAEGRGVELVERVGRINADLTIGADLTKALPLKANDWLCSPGMKLHGKGFIVTPEKAEELGLGRVPGLERHIRPYRNGKDLTQRPRGVMVIDLFGLDEDQVRQRFGDVHQHVWDTVRPEREHNNRPAYRDHWWLFGEPRRDLRAALRGLDRFVATVETSKHRTFQFMTGTTIPDNMLVCFGLDEAHHLAVLSSRVHVAWALAAGGRMGKGNDPRYTKSNCFDKFPFPRLSDTRRATLAALGEELDAHRKERQAAHPDLTITAMHNVLEKMRAGDTLTPKDRDIRQRAQLATLEVLHARIDREVIAAYGWEAHISDEDMLASLVALNRRRAMAERMENRVHWLRPDYQKPRAGIAPPKPSQKKIDLPVVEPTEKPRWPRTLPEKARLVRALLSDQMKPLTAAEVNRLFASAKKERVDSVAEVLDTLVSLSQAHRSGDRYVGR